MATGTTGLFRSEKSAAVLLGVIAIYLAFPFAPLAFLLGPAVARRSFSRLLLAVTHFLVAFLVFAFLGSLRNHNPLGGVLHLWECYCYPLGYGFHEMFYLPHQLDFGILMLWLNAALVQVRCGQRPGLRFEPPLGAAVGAVFAGTVTALALFVMSGIPVMNDRVFIPWHRDPEGVLCFVIYSMIFPLTPLVTLSVHDALTRVLRNDPSPSPTAGADTGQRPQ